MSAKFVRALAVTACASALCGGIVAQDAFVVRLGRTHVGEGHTLSEGWMVVRNGRIAQIGAEAPSDAQDLPILDAREKVVMPGLVAADTDLGGNGDADYNVTPDFLAIGGFDFSRQQTKALSGGVTTAYLAPGRNRLVPGQGSVVKLFGDDVTRRALDEAGCLRVTLGEASTKSPPLFEPSPAPTADDPLVGARRQVPTARISQLAELRRLFREAQVAVQQGRNDLGTGAIEDHYDAAPLLAVLRGDLPLRVAASRADDIRRALQLAGALGARLILEDPAELDRVASLALRAGAVASFRIPVRPGQSNAGGENRRDETPRVTLEAIAAAARVGVPIALSAANDGDLPDLLLLAALAVRAGMTVDQAIAAVTSQAAKVLGVADRVGSLAPGRDADFVILSGEPLATGTVVEKTFVDGQLAYERTGGSHVLAVRARKILTATGSTVRDAVMLIENGKIKAIGEGLTIPYGARIIDTQGVVVPGFVDAYSHAGLAAPGGDGQIPKGAAEQLVAAAIAPDDAALRSALAAGVTTVVVAGRDEGPISGRAAALKTGTSDREHMVVAPIAALRLVHDAIGPDTLEPLDSLLERGRRYIEAWEKYEKAIAEGREVEVTIEAKPLDADPVTGVWECDIENDQLPFAISFNVNAKLAGEVVTGQITLVFRGTERPPVDIEGGTFKDGKLHLGFAMGMGGSVTLDATVGDDTFDGTLSGGFFSGKVKGKRVSKDAPAGGAPGDNTLRKPRIDESLEPVRALLEQRTVAIARSNRAPAIEAVLEWATKNKVKLVLHGGTDAARTPALLGATPQTGVCLEPDFVVDEDGQEINRARQFADAGIPFALVSAATLGASFLPVHAAYAVRHGLDPAAALAAVTLTPARLLGLDKRVGSLEPGKDADFVVFSGEPFELTSRIEAVVCNGDIVIDNRHR